MAVSTAIEPHDIASLVASVESRFRLIEEISPRADGKEFVPDSGWHTIRVGGAYPDDLGIFRIWARLFHNYSLNQVGKTLFWRDVVHYDREKRELIGTLCIQ